MKSITNSLIVFGVFAAEFTYAAPAKNILVLHSYRAGYEWTDEITRGIRTSFERARDVIVWFDFLEARRRPYPQSADEFREYLQRRHRGQSFDLVLAVDDEALDFVLHHSRGMFDQTPVVFCGVAPSPLTANLPRQRVTGVLELAPAARLLDLALKQHPRTRNLYLVVDNSVQGLSVKQQVLEALQAKSGLSVHLLDGAVLPVSEIAARLRTAPPDSLVLMNQYRQDQAFRYVSADEGEYALAAAANMPVYGVLISQVGRGILAGTPNEGFDHGSIASQPALRVLKGEPPERIPLLTDYPHRFPV